MSSDKHASGWVCDKSGLLEHAGVTFPHVKMLAREQEGFTSFHSGPRVEPCYTDLAHRLSFQQASDSNTNDEMQGKGIHI